MFKGFEILTGEEWISILYKSGLKEMPYIGGAAVRRLIVGSEQHTLKDLQVVTTNESPPSEPIPFHHEMAQTPNPPSHIAFYCKLQAVKGGSTPLIRSDLIFDWIESNYPELVPKFEAGVIYTRRVPEVKDATSAIGNSWKGMFQVETREQAEEVMPQRGFKYEWVEAEDGS